MRVKKPAIVPLLTLALTLVATEVAPSYGIGVSVATVASPAAFPAPRAAKATTTLEQRRSQQNMCADCDRLREQLRIVAEKAEVFDAGLRMLRATRREMTSNRSAAAGLAAAYTILQSVNVAFGLATLPCSIPQQWLRGAIGGAAGLGAYVQDSDAGDATLAAVVSSLGLGVVSDASSTYEFMQRYRDEAAGLDALERDVERTIDKFEAARNALQREGRALESDLSRGGCSFDRLDELLRR